MNGFILLLPLLLIRYGVLFALNKSAWARAAFFPPREGLEKRAYWVYQLSTVLIFVTMCFLHVQTGSWWFRLGIGVYLAGLLIFAKATADFARPADPGIHRNGLYRFSRNPMYIGYFATFLGCALLTGSFPLFLLVLVFQVSAHWIILSEERWCLQTFGEAYARYMQEVRRYL